MGRKARLKAARRDEKRSFKLPACSYQMCVNDRPPGTHLVRKVGKDAGEFLTACDDCLEPMLATVRAEGIDVQVYTRAALLHLDAAARKKVDRKNTVRTGPEMETVAQTVAALNAADKVETPPDAPRYRREKDGTMTLIATTAMLAALPPPPP